MGGGGAFAEVRLHQSNSTGNYQPAARESQGFQSENRRIFFFAVFFSPLFISQESAGC